MRPLSGRSTHSSCSSWHFGHAVRGGQKISRSFVHRTVDRRPSRNLSKKREIRVDSGPSSGKKSRRNGRFSSVRGRSDFGSVSGRGSERGGTVSRSGRRG